MDTKSSHLIARALNLIALIIGAAVILNELSWLSKSKVAYVLTGLGIAVVLNAISGMMQKK